jgi:hypothetical protein
MKKSFILLVILFAAVNFTYSMERADRGNIEQEVKMSQAEAARSAIASRLTTPTPPRDPFLTTGRVVATPARNELARVLVIPSSAMKMPEIAAIREDLAIMSRILDRRTGPDVIVSGAIEESVDSQALIDIIRFGATQGLRQNLTESIYIGGFGAIFSMKADFPLLPPPEGIEPKETGKDMDNLWEQTRREIYSPPVATSVTPSVPRRQIRRPIYDAEKVEELKAKLIESLKHAANIRVLRPDEWVVIAVTGPGIQPDGGPEEVSYGMGGLPGGTTTGLPLGIYPELQEQMRIKGESSLKSGFALTRPFAQTCLTIRAKKADIDEFAKGAITLESFKQRLEIITY